jgi:hypothetical protein
LILNFEKDGGRAVTVTVEKLGAAGPALARQNDGPRSCKDLNRLPCGPHRAAQRKRSPAKAY